MISIYVFPSIKDEQQALIVLSHETDFRSDSLSDNRSVNLRDFLLAFLAHRL